MSARVGLPIYKILGRAVHGVASLADRLSAFICAVLIMATTVAMIVYQFGIAIAWLDDVLRLLLIWLVYLGAVSLCLHNDHISMDALSVLLPKAVRKATEVAIALLGVGLCLFIAKIGFDSMRREIAYGALLPSGYIPAWPQSLAIPLGFGLMAVACLSHLLSVLSGQRQGPPGEPVRQAAEG